MGLYANYATDAELEKNGAVCDLGENGVWILARAGGQNEKFARELRRITKPHKRAILADTIDPKLAEKLTIEAFSKTVVLGWLKKGEPLPGSDPANPVLCEHDVTGPDGQPLPFSPAAVKMLLTDLPDLYQDLKAFAEDSSTFQRGAVEEEGKSSPASSDTP